MDTKEAFCCPRIAERSRFHRGSFRQRERDGEREIDREDTKSNMLDELWVEEGEPGKLIL